MLDNEKLFAIGLADNEKKNREKTMRKIRSYIHARSVSTTQEPFSEEDMIKIWKGLHYCLWMCDKQLVQEDLAEKISSLVFSFNNNDDQTLLFIQTYFKTIMREWNGIDKWRMDKFLMCMRLMLNKSFGYLKSKKWNKEITKKFLDMLCEYPLNVNDDNCPGGICYHLADIYLEELGKYGESLKPVKAVRMIYGFCKCLAISKKRPFVLHLVERFFKQIIECSDVGINPEDEEELEETRAYGLETGETEDTSEYVIKFDYDKIADLLFKMSHKKFCLVRNIRPIYDLVQKFRALAKGIYPIDDFNLPSLNDNDDNNPLNQNKKKKKKKIGKKNKKAKKSNDDEDDYDQPMGDDE